MINLCGSRDTGAAAWQGVAEDEVFHKGALDLELESLFYISRGSEFQVVTWLVRSRTVCELNSAALAKNHISDC